jgi:hypothetical protein
MTSTTTLPMTRPTTPAATLATRTMRKPCTMIPLRMLSPIPMVRQIPSASITPVASTDYSPKNSCGGQRLQGSAAHEPLACSNVPTRSTLAAERRDQDTVRKKTE